MKDKPTTPQGPLADYKDFRKAEYPSIEEQLDMLYHQGYEGWRAKIEEIKNKFPKEDVL